MTWRNPPPDDRGLPPIDDATAESLLAGGEVRSDLEPVAAFLRALRGTARRRVAPSRSWPPRWPGDGTSGRERWRTGSVAGWPERGRRRGPPRDSWRGRASAAWSRRCSAPLRPGSPERCPSRRSNASSPWWRRSPVTPSRRCRAAPGRPTTGPTPARPTRLVPPSRMWAAATPGSRPAGDRAATDRARPAPTAAATVRTVRTMAGRPVSGRRPGWGPSRRSGRPPMPDRMPPPVRALLPVRAPRVSRTTTARPVGASRIMLASRTTLANRSPVARPVPPASPVRARRVTPVGRTTPADRALPPRPVRPAHRSPPTSATLASRAPLPSRAVRPPTGRAVRPSLRAGPLPDPTRRGPTRAAVHGGPPRTIGAGWKAAGAGPRAGSGREPTVAGRQRLTSPAGRWSAGRRGPPVPPPGPVPPAAGR